MPMAALLALLCQEPITVPFADKLRAQYVEAVQSCRAAQEKAAADPEAAERELGAVLQAHRELVLERRVTVYERPNAPATYNLCPWQYRGQVRLALARRPGAPEAERRRHLREAVDDLEKSAGQKNVASEPLLREARKDLWPLVRAQLRYEAPEPAPAGEARRLLATVEDPPTAAKDLSEEVGRVRDRVLARKAEVSSAEFRRGRSARDLEWCDRLGGEVKGLEAFRDVEVALSRLREAAAYRGVFRLKVAVHPFAEKVALVREGHPVAVPAQATPLVVPGPLEIGAFEVELRAPKGGSKAFSIKPGDLKDAGTYILSGDVATGAFTLTEQE